MIFQANPIRNAVEKCFGKDALRYDQEKIPKYLIQKLRSYKTCQQHWGSSVHQRGMSNKLGK